MTDVIHGKGYHANEYLRIIEHGAADDALDQVKGKNFNHLQVFRLMCYIPHVCVTPHGLRSVTAGCAGSVPEYINPP